MSAETRPAADGPPLTRNQGLVLDTLTSAQGPLSAYAILDALREEGFRAPLQVYRALEKLVGEGLVHRLESLNAYVACRHGHGEAHETIAFAICDRCGDVRELEDGTMGDELNRLAAEAAFQLRASVVEMRGVCADCAA